MDLLRATIQSVLLERDWKPAGRFGETEMFQFNLGGTRRVWGIAHLKRLLAEDPPPVQDMPVAELAKHIDKIDVSMERAADDARWAKMTPNQVDFLRELHEYNRSPRWSLSRRELDDLFQRKLVDEFPPKRKGDVVDYGLTPEGSEWAAEVFENDLDELLLDDMEGGQIDLSVPIIVADTEEWGLLPIDGWHRIAKAKWLDKKTLPAVVLSDEMSRKAQGLLEYVGNGGIGSLMDKVQQAIKNTDEMVYPHGWAVHSSEEVGPGTILITLERIQRKLPKLMGRTITPEALRAVETAVEKGWTLGGHKPETVTAKDQGASRIEVSVALPDRTGDMSWGLP